MKTLNLILIRQRRKEMRISLQEMAETLGYKNASSYCRYEKGESKIDAAHIPLIAKKLKLKMSDIFFDQNFAKSANQ